MKIWRYLQRGSLYALSGFEAQWHRFLKQFQTLCSLSRFSQTWDVFFLTIILRGITIALLVNIIKTKIIRIILAAQTRSDDVSIVWNMEGVHTLVVVPATSPVPALNDDGLCNHDDDYDDLCVRSTLNAYKGILPASAN